MNLNDPIGDMLTRIRNGQRVSKQTIESPFSSLRKGVLDVMEREGYIRGYQLREIRKGISSLSVELKYSEGAPVIAFVKKVSTPGRRVYKSISDLQVVRNGLGISILSTSKGVLSDAEARNLGVGGEVICQIF